MSKGINNLKKARIFLLIGIILIIMGSVFTYVMIDIRMKLGEMGISFRDIKDLEYLLVSDIIIVLYLIASIIFYISMKRKHGK